MAWPWHQLYLSSTKATHKEKLFLLPVRHLHIFHRLSLDTKPYVQLFTMLKIVNIQLCMLFSCFSKYLHSINWNCSKMRNLCSLNSELNHSATDKSKQHIAFFQKQKAEEGWKGLDIIWSFSLLSIGCNKARELTSELQKIFAEPDLSHAHIHFTLSNQTETVPTANKTREMLGNKHFSKSTYFILVPKRDLTSFETGLLDQFCMPVEAIGEALQMLFFFAFVPATTIRYETWWLPQAC